MQKELVTTIEMLRQIRFASNIKMRRNFADFFADRILQAATEKTLLKLTERLSVLVNASTGEIKKDVISDYLKIAMKPDSNIIVSWLREYPKLAVMLCFIKDDEERRIVTSDIDIDIADKPQGVAVKRRPFDIGITVTCTTPLAHGSDIKAGNATLFRRMAVLSDTESVLSLPYYAGNAVRGAMRDVLADHFLESIGYTPRRDRPPVELWFFHALYSGGALSEQSKTLNDIMAVAGKNALRSDGIRQIRDMWPALSLLGFAFGNRVLSGRCNVGDLRPECKQWGFDSDIDVNDLFEWVFLTRREDHEGHADDSNSSMIANCETLKAGVILHGGIDYGTYLTDIERGALARGLLLLQKRGRLGAEARRDLGGVQIQYGNLPDPAPYDDFLKSKKNDIIEFMNSVGAFKEALETPQERQMTFDAGADGVGF